MDFNTRDQRWRGRRRDGGKAGPARPEGGADLEETLRLDGPGAGESEQAAARRALAETLPAQRGAGPDGYGPGSDAAGSDTAGSDAAGGVTAFEASAFDGSGFDGSGFAGAGLDPGAADARRALSRRVLFAAGGLALVGGGAVAAASRLPSSGSAAAARPSGGAAPAAPASSRHSPSQGASTPSDLSSSTGTSSPPPDVSNPGSGIDPSKVQSAPEYYVHAGPKVIALTLDDGPSALYTPQILAVLQQYKITATFCMIGQQVGANRSLVSEVVAAGHTVVNHTWNHADQSKLALAQIRSQISRANDALVAAGAHPKVFRAPYGAWSHAVYQACAEADLRPLAWSVDPRDWSRPGVAAIVSRILAATRTGSIILDHDGGGDRSQTVAALKIVLPKLLEAGYRFTTV